MNEPRSGAGAGSALLPDGRAFDVELRAAHPRLRALAIRILHDAAAADDALQLAYLKAYRNLAGFRGGGEFSSWLYPIVYRTCIDEHRRRRPTEPLDHEAPDDLPELADSVSTQLDVRAALALLSPTQRAAVWLVDAEAMTFAEAAKVMDLPPGTVASRVSRARAVLRRTLTEEEQ